MAKRRLPRHVGFIPDGNRRWAADRELPKEAGYAHGIEPGLALFEDCKARGIEEAEGLGPVIGPLQQRIALQFLLHEGRKVKVRQLQQLDRLHQLRRHNQRLRLAEF